MRVADITMMGEIISIHPEDTKAIMGAREKLNSGRSFFLLNEDGTAYICFDPVFEGKWVGHVLSRPEARGKELWAFAQEAMEWAVEYLELEHLFGFVETKNRPLNVFLRRLGMQKVNEFDEHSMYFINEKKIKEGKSCHR